MNLMNYKKRIGLGAVLGIVFIFMEYFVHHIFLRDAYQATAFLWRPGAQMKTFLPLILLAELLFGILFGVVYAQGYEPRRAPLGQGVRYGIIMGLMIAPMSSLIWFAVLPVAPCLAMGWLFYGFAEILILGAVASMIYRPS